VFDSGISAGAVAAILLNLLLGTGKAAEPATLPGGVAMTDADQR
jgi:xanthine/uracil permease